MARYLAVAAVLCVCGLAQQEDRGYEADTRPWQQRMWSNMGPSAPWGYYAPHGMGFHGDVGLLAVLSAVITSSNITTFIESGTHLGCSAAHTMRTFPTVTNVFTAENSPAIHSYAQFEMKEVIPLWAHSVAKSGRVPRYAFSLALSTQLLEALVKSLPAILQEPTLFWLDAHSPNLQNWPGPEEVAVVTTHWPRGLIMFDDFFLPDKSDIFGYDSKDYNVPLLAKSIPPSVNYAVYYPRYTLRTSPFHPLRGWVVLQFWSASLPAPARLDTSSILPPGILYFHQGHSRVPFTFTLHINATLVQARAVRQAALSPGVATTPFAGAVDPTQPLHIPMPLRLAAAHGPALSPLSSSVYGQGAAAPLKAALQQLEASVAALQRPPVCDGVRAIALPPLAVLERGYVQGYASMPPEDRFAAVMLVLAAWLSVGRATGRTVLVLPLSSFPGAERWELASAEVCGSAVDYACFFSQPLSSCDASFPFYAAAPLDADAVASDLLAFPHAVSSHGPDVVTAPLTLTPAVRTLLRLTTSPVATTDLPTALKPIWFPFFLERVMASLSPSVLNGTIVGMRSQRSLTELISESLRSAATNPELSSLSVGATLFAAQNTSPRAGFDASVDEVVSYANAIHTALVSSHGLLFVSQLPQEWPEAALLTAEERAAGVTTPSDTLYLKAGPKFSVWSQGAGPLQDFTCLHEVNAFIGDCSSPYAHMVASSSLLQGVMVLPPISARAGECRAQWASSPLSFLPPLDWRSEPAVWA